MLTPDQEAIARHKSGHAKVLATAGSGKSTTMVARILNLLVDGVPPPEILSVMFNRDARDGFRLKLQREVGSREHCPPVFTFHGLGGVILNRLIDQKKLPKAKLEASEYRLFNHGKEALEPWLKPEGGRRVINDFLSFVDLCKSSLAAPVDIFSEYGFAPKYRFFLEAFNRFEKSRQRKHLRFFADLIYDPVKYLVSNKTEVSAFADRYQHVIIDEGQDISEVQQTLVELVAGKRASVMIVADDDQCIYTWRGAKPGYLIDGFDKKFKNAKTYYIRSTFRYGHQISLAANHLIKNNRCRIAKMCLSHASTPRTEIALDVEKVGQPSVPNHVAEWARRGRKLSEIAVLVRSYSQAVPIEIALLTKGVAYRVEGGTPIFDTPDIGALVTALHLANKTFASLDLREKARLASNFVRSPTMALPYGLEGDLRQALFRDPDGTPELLDDMQFRVKEKWVRERLQRRAMAWRNLSCLDSPTPLEVVDYAIEFTGVKHHIQYVAKSEEDAEELWRRYECIRTYIGHKALSLADFVDHVDSLRRSYVHGDSHDALIITSVHRSKGMEWPFVIMPGLSQGRFPLIPRTADQPWSVEDERRLFYVAMTRAREKLVLISPMDKRLQRYLSYGSDTPPDDIPADPANASQFIYETNLFLSQRADQIVSAPGGIPAEVASPEVARHYIQQLQTCPS